MNFNKWTIEEVGLPDGMTIDVEGKLWIAGYLSSKVMQFDPVTGRSYPANMHHISCSFNIGCMIITPFQIE